MEDLDPVLTLTLIVGEIVRYLLSAPPSPNDRKHQIRLIWGNGLGSDVWQRFQVGRWDLAPSTDPNL